MLIPVEVEACVGGVDSGDVVAAASWALGLSTWWSVSESADIIGVCVLVKSLVHEKSVNKNIYRVSDNITSKSDNTTHSQYSRMTSPVM